MRPIPLFHPDRLPSIDARPIAWGELVVARADLDVEAHGYLRAIRRYSNEGREDRGFGVLAAEALFRADAELDALLETAHGTQWLHRPLFARFVSILHAASPLPGVPETPDAIEHALLHPRVESHLAPSWLGPFHLEGRLAEYLYRYGMYVYFWQEHAPAEAREHARALVRDRLRDDLDTMVVLHTGEPWSAWFDPHSITDWSVLMIDRRDRLASLLAFSHSD